MGIIVHPATRDSQASSRFMMISSDWELSMLSPASQPVVPLTPAFSQSYFILSWYIFPLFRYHSVSHPGLKAQGLCLNSTAIRHTGEGVPLWFQRSTHQGQPTGAPYLPNLV